MNTTIQMSDGPSIFENICKDIYFECHDAIYKLFDMTEDGLNELLDIKNYHKVMDNIIEKTVLKYSEYVVKKSCSGNVAIKLINYVNENGDSELYVIMTNIYNKLKTYQSFIRSDMLTKNKDIYMQTIHNLLN